MKSPPDFTRHEDTRKYRALDISNIAKIALRHETPLLVIAARRGLGKSLTSNEVMRFFADRRYFKGAMITMDLRKWSRSSEVVKNLLQVIPEQFKASVANRDQIPSVDIIAKYFNSLSDRRSILCLDNVDRVMK